MPIQNKWILVPLSDITTPKEGRICYSSRWWLVTSNNEVLFYKSYNSPQCNGNKKLSEYLAGRISKEIEDSNLTCQFIDMAFIPHDCGDY